MSVELGQLPQYNWLEDGLQVISQVELGAQSLRLSVTFEGVSEDRGVDRADLSFHES